MPSFQKSRLSKAMGAALGGLLMVPALSSAFSVDVENATLRTDDGGDALLLSPVTSVFEVGGGGWIFAPDGSVIGTADLKATTNISLTNTSDGYVVLAKVRFREQKRSMETMDFIVALTPQDKFDFWVAQDGNRGSGDIAWNGIGGPGELPYVAYNDTTCVIGGPRVVDADGNTRMSFPTAASNRYVDNVEDMSFGHAEVIGMAAYGPGSDVYEWSRDHECDQLRSAFNGSRNNPAQLAVITEGSMDVPNVLLGRLVITANGKGIEDGINAVSIKNALQAPYVTFQTGATCVPDSEDNGANVNVTPNDTNDLTNPCHSLYAWDNNEAAHPHLGDMQIPFWNGNGDLGAGVDGLDSEMRANILAGDWSNNGVNNVTSDWIVNFPAKYVYIDWANCDEGNTSEWCLVNYMTQAASEIGPIDSVTNPPGLNNRRDVCVRDLVSEGTPWGMETCFDPRPYDSATALCLPDNLMQLWDTRENTFSLVSPSPDGLFDLCNESQVLTISQDFEYLPGQTPVEAFPSLIQYQNRRIEFTFAPMEDQKVNRGHAQLNLNWDYVPHRGFYGYGAATEGALSIIRRTDGIQVNNGSMAQLARLLTPRADE